MVPISLMITPSTARMKMPPAAAASALRPRSAKTPRMPKNAPMAPRIARMSPRVFAGTLSFTGGSAANDGDKSWSSIAFLLPPAPMAGRTRTAYTAWPSLTGMSEGLVVRPITRSRFPDVEALFKTDSIMRSCWDIWPRYAGKTDRAEIDARHRGSRQSEVNRLELQRLAARRRAPGLLAYDGREPVG